MLVPGRTRYKEVSQFRNHVCQVERYSPVKSRRRLDSGKSWPLLDPQSFRSRLLALCPRLFHLLPVDRARLISTRSLIGPTAATRRRGCIPTRVISSSSSEPAPASPSSARRHERRRSSVATSPASVAGGSRSIVGRCLEGVVAVVVDRVRRGEGFGGKRTVRVREAVLRVVTPKEVDTEVRRVVIHKLNRRD